MSRVISRTIPGGTCVVNRDDFIKSFEDVPKITITSLSDAKSKIEDAISILSKSQEDWTKRMNQLKAIRSIVIHAEDVVGRENLLSLLIRLTDCLDLSVKDLRSQILREAAITCSFLFQRYGNDVHQIAERCLPSAFSQVSVSTKVMATSGATLTLFIVQYVQTKQIFTCITSYATSKDKNQRRQVCGLLEVVIEHWNDKIKKMFLPQIGELIKAAICDADPETRTAGRKAFKQLDSIHPDDAEKLFLSVDSQKQKMLRTSDAASSSTSINSERGSTQFRSKLSAGSIGGIRNVPNISSKFLAQRSASAIDTKQVSRMTTSVSRTPGTRPMASRTLSKVDTSPGGSKFARPTVGVLGPRTTSNLRSRGSVPTSQPGSRNGSPGRRPSTTSSAFPPEMQRVKSNLGSGSFVSSLTSEQAEKLQKAMNTAKESLGQPSRNDDDEFLLPKRPTKPKSPQKGADTRGVEAILRACSSTSANEKKEGIKSLSTLVLDPSLSPLEVKNIGTVLIRLLAEATNPIVLESVSAFVQTHHTRLSEWLKLGLVKMFQKKGSEMMQNMKKQISATIMCILTSFDSNLLLKSTCELMCDPIQLLPPKARVALLEFLNDLLDKHMERGSSFNNKEMKATILKMFSWMTDQRNGQMLTPYAEKVLCSLFSLNSADFSTLLNDFNNDYRDWAYRILQSHGHSQQAPPQETVSSGEEVFVRANISNTAAQIEDFVVTRNMEMSEKSPLTKSVISPTFKRTDVEPLRPLTSEMNSQPKEEDLSFNESFDRLKMNSTTHLIDDVAEQSKYVSAKLSQIIEGSQSEQYEGLLSIQTMLCEGSFTLWEHNFAKLLLAVFDVLSKSDSDSNKKVALRVLTKMCTSQASRLFDSTEMAICKVLDSAVNSKDGTMNVTADDCLKTLATHLPLAKVVNISKLILNEGFQEKAQEARASLILKMMTELFIGLQADELNPVIEDLAPCAIKAYDSPSSTVRKAAVYCLVAMVNKLGMRTMEPHLQQLSSGKLNLVQVYVNRAMSSSSHSHV